MGSDSRGRDVFIGLARLALAGALLLVLTAPAAHATRYLPGFEERTIVGGLTEPTAMAWAPDGRLFVIEKPGRLKVVETGGTSATTILDISSRVNDFHDRGLLGVAVDSAFASNSYIYLLYTYDVRPLTADSDAPMVSRLERYTVGPSNVVGSPTVLLGSYVEGACPAPSNSVDCIPSDSITHSIGTIRSAPDGTLWVGSGDGTDTIVDPLTFRTYDERSMAGKILHVDRDGRGLPGHPFCPADTNLDHVCTKVWAGGFRNPFRFKLRPRGGLTVGDVGAQTREELNLIPTSVGGGRLYGWPCYEGSTRTLGYRDRVECGDEYAKEGTPNAHVAPDYEYAHDGGRSAAVLGGPTYTGTQYPLGYRDDAFFSDYALGFIRKANVDAQGRIVSVDDFATEWSGVDLEPDPNGDLAYASFGDGSPGSGSIRRIVYSPGNGSPVAMASAAPISGQSPLDVSFTGSSSTDPDGDPLSYDWDFGDGSAHSSLANPTHRYTTNGAFTAQLTVSDGRGLSGTDTVTISVGDPPVASIDSPGVGGVPANPAPGASPHTTPGVGAGRDVTRPVVRITSPARRVRVSGRIMVRASASDNVGVRSVQFRLDGKRLGRVDARAPFRVRWNTRRVRNGAHRLIAVARDGAGNMATSQVVRVTVRNKRFSASGPRHRRKA